MRGKNNKFAGELETKWKTSRDRLYSSVSNLLFINKLCVLTN
jgi:hypothetical protein